MHFLEISLLPVIVVALIEFESHFHSCPSEKVFPAVWGDPIIYKMIKYLSLLLRKPLNRIQSYSGQVFLYIFSSVDTIQFTIQLHLHFLPRSCWQDPHGARGAAFGSAPPGTSSRTP